jgi:formate hydrogenlyase subunit 3/multisubunit Na+/H+ antiporter MnhD subunit
MSDTGVFDRKRIRDAYGAAPSLDGRLAVALGAIAILIGLGAAGAGAWLAYGHTASIMPLPGGLPAAESSMISIYLVACGALTMLVGAFSIYKAQDM